MKQPCLAKHAPTWVESQPEGFQTEFPGTVSLWTDFPPGRVALKPSRCPKKLYPTMAKLKPQRPNWFRTVFPETVSQWLGRVVWKTACPKKLYPTMVTPQRPDLFRTDLPETVA